MTEYFRRCTDAMNAGDWSTALEWIRKCVVREPANVLFRQVARGVAMKRADTRRFTIFDLERQTKKINTAISTKDWFLVDSLAENGLAFYPRDLSLNYTQAVANYALKRRDIARFACETALASDREHSEALRLWLRIKTDRYS